MTNGCTRYIETTCKIYFQPEHMNCSMCPLMGEYPREHCNRTGEYLLNTKTQIGWECPLVITENNPLEEEQNDES